MLSVKVSVIQTDEELRTVANKIDVSAACRPRYYALARSGP